MDKDDNKPMIETSDEGHPIEIYTDERIREFFAEDQMTPEEKKRIEEKLKESNTLKSPPQTERS
jgi:hypothetical protein